MEATYNDPQNADQEEMQFLYQIRKELSLETSHEAVRLVASVLQALRQTLTLENATALVNRLPDFLKLAFASNWERGEKRVPVEHLDEFVGLIMERDERSGKGLFRNEVQTLLVAILTLKKLNKLVDLEGFEGISSALKQELREVSPEAAA
jgi:uncharacterized protein (DUF2267 family)